MNISVIIPVKNGGSTIEKCLQSLQNQTGVNLQIIILDSGSNDESKNIALKYTKNIVDINPQSFNHGATRNLGVKYAKHDLVFFTVQDAYLAESDTLYKMSIHFNNELVMGVVGHQAVPHHNDKNPYLWYRPVSKPTVTIRYLESLSNFLNLPVQQQMDLIAWDNVVAMYRHKSLRILPFEITSYAEDWIWCNSALKKQWTLIYDSSVIVYHYHHQNFKYAFNTSFIINKQMYIHFGYITPLPALFLPIARVIYFFGKQKQFSFSEKFYWIANNIGRTCGNFVANWFLRLIIFIKGKKKSKEYFKIHKSIIPQGKQKI